MENYIIVITEPAVDDLSEIGIYISKELLEPSIAQNVIAKIGKVVMKLAELPLRNPLVLDERLALQGIRKIVIDNYVVLYIVDEKNKIVTIVRILYNRRHWINLL